MSCVVSARHVEQRPVLVVLRRAQPRDRHEIRVQRRIALRFPEGVRVLVEPVRPERRQVRPNDPQAAQGPQPMGQVVAVVLVVDQRAHGSARLVQAASQPPPLPGLAGEPARGAAARPEFIDRGSGAEPLHQPHAALAGRTLLVVAGAGDESIHGHRHVQDDACHDSSSCLLDLCSRLGTPETVALNESGIFASAVTRCGNTTSVTQDFRAG
jgi:hypothetical protein